MAYIQGNSAPRANLGVLNKLIAARHEFAQVNLIHFISFLLEEICTSLSISIAHLEIDLRDFISESLHVNSDD